ncbi:hypothetical protein [Azospirillum sp.]|uniref:hypothetical protein n=1 Tax=Azospirillum sp. TaxID=34012 RepID=UPI002D72B730|nr:hypothetical protein [Azospirillum sp.]HYD67005.1 hypothetical protein [Azospirillum sp.]
MHPRTVIRHALVAHLGQPLPDTDPPSYRTAAGDRVYAARSAPVPSDGLPCLAVHTGEDVRDASAPANAEGPERRLLTIVVEGVVEGSAPGANADDAADALALEVESAVRADPTLGGLVEGIRLERTATAATGSGDDQTVVAKLTFGAVYYAHLPAGDGPPPPTQLYGSWEPNTGPAHLDDYQRIEQGQLPEVR